MAQIQSVMKMKMEMQQLGSLDVGKGYVAAKSFEVLQNAAKNPGATGATFGAVTGLGLGLGVAGGSFAQSITNATQIEKDSSSNTTLVKRLMTLKQMYENNLLTKEEYERKRNQIIDEI